MRTVIAALLMVFAATATATAEARPQGYYEVSPDTRRCASPACGGHWVKALNEALTRCADGSRADRCYVARLDWSTSEYSPPHGQRVLRGEDAVIVRGDFAPHDVGLGDASFWELDVTGLWAAGSGAEATGKYYVVGPTRWWYGWDRANRLNSRQRYWFTEIQVGRVGATPEQLAAAEQAYHERQLIVSSESDAARDYTLSATNFFVPVPVLPSDACLSHVECGEGEHCGDNGARCITFPCDVNYDVCKPQEASGGYCEDAQFCQAGLDCIDNLCSLPRDECAVDADCDNGFCGWAWGGERICKAWGQEGDACEGWPSLGAVVFCEPHLTCTNPVPYLADLGGICALAASPSELASDPKRYAGHVVGVRGDALAGLAACTKRYCAPEVQCCNVCNAEQLLFDEGTDAGGIALKEGDEFYTCNGQDCDYQDNCSKPEGDYIVIGTFTATVDGDFIDIERIERASPPEFF